MDFRPVYRLTVYATDNVTPLTPRAGAPHSDPFQVATAKGIAGFQPYLGLPRGRRGQVDPLGHKVDVGAMTFPILDVRTAGQDNVKRWVTAFAGDADGKNPLMGARLFCEESVDGGTTWAPFFTGTVTRPGLKRTRLWFALHARDLADRLQTRVFTGPPSSAVTDYAKMPSLMPIGLVEPYADMDTQPWLPGTVIDWEIPGNIRSIEVDKALLADVDPDDVATIVTQGFWDAIQEPPRQDENFIRSARVRAKMTSGPNLNETGEFLIRTGDLAPGLWPTTVDLQIARPPFSGHWTFKRVGIKALPAADPNHLPLPDVGETCEFYIRLNGPPTEHAPLLIDDVHPMRFKRDILAGHFGPLDEDGNPQITMEHEGFAALIADDTWGTSRWLIRGP